MNGVDFEAIYANDLVYVPDCWKLCGDAHCCSFARHKARFRLIGARSAQELPLLPGEYAFLEKKGYLAQFGDHEHRRIDYAFGHRRLVAESILSRRPGCACDHATRPTICRLYPLFPVFDVDGSLTGIERVGMYDMLEEMDGLERACRVDAIPQAEIARFLALTSCIARDPLALFHMEAYRLAHRHLRQRLIALRGDGQASFFQIFEANVLRGRLIDHAALGEALGNLAGAFEARHGATFALPGAVRTGVRRPAPSARSKPAPRRPPRRESRA